jgi:hypothetical protein
MIWHAACKVIQGTKAALQIFKECVHCIKRRSKGALPEEVGIYESHTEL